jgi:uncharacterized repeat protein (TIGR03803 family)
VRSEKPLILFSIVILFVTSTWAAPDKILHNFKDNGRDGHLPYAGLISDAAGNLYGTTAYGGTGTCNLGCGTVYELSSRANGWVEKILHNFKNSNKEGNAPTASLIFDTAGNLYGTTAYGGVGSVGTVFELTPKTDGSWTEKVLHSFGGRNDGNTPRSGLIFDNAGNLYGTTSDGGAQGSYGTVYELSPKAGGGWKEKVLHNFIAIRGDGAYPFGGLIYDSAGNLYGTTAGGGASGYGTVFQLVSETAGWVENILYSFGPGTDGYGPSSGVILDASGNIYGSTFFGGAGTCIFEGTGCGTVFELNRQADWAETVIHSFNDNGDDGTFPAGGLIFDTAGNVYGSTSYGGTGTCPIPNLPAGCGTVYQLAQAGGTWTETVLHSFNNNGKDGNYPTGSLILDANAGNLYGATERGGAGTNCEGYNCGTVFKITP